MLYKQEDPSSDIQHPRKKPGMACFFPYNHRAGVGGDRWVGRQADEGVGAGLSLATKSSQNRELGKEVKSD